MILVTHAVQYLSAATNVLVLHDSRVAFHGSHRQVWTYTARIGSLCTFRQGCRSLPVTCMLPPPRTKGELARGRGQLCAAAAAAAAAGEPLASVLAPYAHTSQEKTRRSASLDVQEVERETQSSRKVLAGLQMTSGCLRESA